MKNIMVGTSGHIDHGKTTLIKALTGRETDTLEEEKKRGISINLGFTYFDLPNGSRVGIVDVPGHEKFIKNMMAGASGLDVVLLVIAADEGVMPQTVEHIDILSYLNIKHGIIVLTKCDMVEDEFLDLVEEDVRERLKDTFMKDADIVRVDSVSRRGLDELVKKIEEVDELVEPKNESSPARLNIDRVFSIKGFGTVVTGTLLEGVIKKDDELELYPKKLKAKIRSIQVHGTDVECAYAGQRTAINISNIKKSQIERGDVLAKEGTLEESMMIDVKLSLTAHTDKTLKHWDRLRLFHGTREIFCRAVPLDSETIEKGQTGFVQLRLEEKIICKKGDPFVVRSYSPVDTIGGGIIVDTSFKKHKAFDESTLEALRIKERGELKDIVEEYLKQYSQFFPEIKEIVAYSGEHTEDVESALNTLIEEKKAIAINSFYIHMSYFKKLEDSTLEILNEFHKKNKLKFGPTNEELRSKTDSKLKTRDVDVLLKLMEDDGIIRIDKNRVQAHNFTVKLTPEQKNMKAKISKELKAAGYTNILTLGDFNDMGKGYKEILESMLGQEATLLDNQYVIDSEIYAQARNMLVNHLKEHGEITLGEYRDLIDSSRKNCMIILESFDKEGLTRRVENKRVLA